MAKGGKCGAQFERAETQDKNERVSIYDAVTAKIIAELEPACHREAEASRANGRLAA